ncbi:TfoX/Sxy family protein [Mesobacterium pallidum]|uniref:TfoX/Sxy family protein n=1 Tax=Mesobacterium pallidum TaxID=2872037 RepID=UPI001EE1CF2C|nr:TfoX/Sxy family protein [Mesobacterium pallidum]
MAYDEGLAQLIRDDLTELDGVSEEKMFGGLCFLRHGHMLGGVTRDGAMFRVGKPSEAAARAIEGAGPMTFTGRPMGGMIEVTADALADDTRRGQWLAMALDHAASLPPK